MSCSGVSAPRRSGAGSRTIHDATPKRPDAACAARPTRFPCRQREVRELEVLLPVGLEEQPRPRLVFAGSSATLGAVSPDFRCQCHGGTFAAPSASQDSARARRVDRLGFRWQCHASVPPRDSPLGTPRGPTCSPLESTHGVVTPLAAVLLAAAAPTVPRARSRLRWRAGTRGSRACTAWRLDAAAAPPTRAARALVGHRRRALRRGVFLPLGERFPEHARRLIRPHRRHRGRASTCCASPASTASEPLRPSRRSPSPRRTT